MTYKRTESRRVRSPHLLRNEPRPTDIIALIVGALLVGMGAMLGWVLIDALMWELTLR